MNSVSLCGTIVQEMKLRNGQYGAFANGSLSVINGKGKIFIPVIAYGEMAENISRISVGSKICINGTLDTYKDSQDMYRISVTIKDYELVSGEIISTLDCKSYW